MQVGPVGAMGWVSTARLLPAPQRPLLLYPRSAAAEQLRRLFDQLEKKDTANLAKAWRAMDLCSGRLQA